MRRTAFWIAVVVAVAAIGGGGWYAYAQYRATSGPAAAVRGYYAALARSDAPAALGYGELPEGPTALLTSAVLREQQQLAPLHDVHIIDVAQAADEATVRYSYRLQFPRDDQEFTGSLKVHDTGGGWRLAQTAVSTQINIDQATDRFSFAGTTVPDGPTLLFPGAVPLHFDTPYLQVDPATAAIQFGGTFITDVGIEPTAAAKASLSKSVTTRLTACLSGKATPAACPAPPPRVIPGSLHGSIDGYIAAHLSFAVATTAAGEININGRLPFQGSYRVLTYDNVAVVHHGKLALPVVGLASASGPSTVEFASAA